MGTHDISWDSIALIHYASRIWTEKALSLNLNQNWLGYSKTGELNFSEKIYTQKAFRRSAKNLWELLFT